uniref:hypothetical protein n=1 Tax=Streptomyces alanosinicus TaxID=68171 RepID=UPI001E4D808A
MTGELVVQCVDGPWARVGYEPSLIGQEAEGNVQVSGIGGRMPGEALYLHGFVGQQPSQDSSSVQLMAILENRQVRSSHHLVGFS